MTSRSLPFSFGRLKFALGGAAFALSLSLASCNTNSSTTTTTTPTGTYTLTVTITGSDGAHEVTLTDAGGTARVYNIYSGAIISGLKGVYTVTAATADKKTPASQTVDLSAGNQAITIAY